MADLVGALGAADQTSDLVRGRPATVTAAPVGGLVSVKFAGDDVAKAVPHLASYVPAEDDVVMVLAFGGNQYLVIGTPA